MDKGWIKLHRKALDNPVVTKDAEYLSVWIYLLLNATHEEYPSMFKGEKIILRPGQLITGCVSIGSRLKISESKVRRILKCFESDGQIVREVSNKNSLITILNWCDYQNIDRQTDGQLTDKWRTTDGQLTDKWRTTDDKQEQKNVKNVKEQKNVEEQKKESYVEETKEIIDYLNQVCGTRYQYTAQKSKEHIRARLKEKYTVDDFKTVIDKKAKDWLNDLKMSKYLRPETLFGTKFESYLNQPESTEGNNNTFVGINWENV